MSALQLTFEYQGKTWTLNKHPDIQQRLRDGAITESQAADYPWYLRQRKGTFKLTPDNTTAITEAKAHLKGQIDKPTEWKEFMNARAARYGITFDQLATEWRALHMPDNAGRPRGQDARAQLDYLLTDALLWWGKKSVVTTTKSHMLAYATHVRQTVSHGTGDRKADKALSVLSCLCQWAAALEKIPANPFLKRPRIQSSKTIRHCHETTCDSDEHFHQILQWFFAEPENHFRIVAGAWLTWCALTGLRREEPSYLFRRARLKEPPASPAKLAPGTIFPTRNGELIMRVQRVKHGQNPYITLHPAAQNFLATWEDYLDSRPTAHESLARPLFPHPTRHEQPYCTAEFRALNEHLERLPQSFGKLTTHGIGRAYYVRVRRSQGADDSVIAGELGQITNGKLIRDTYGNGDDLRGGALFDWLPETNGKATPPAWQLLTEQTTAATNIIQL